MHPVPECNDGGTDEESIILRSFCQAEVFFMARKKPFHGITSDFRNGPVPAVFSQAMDEDFFQGLFVCDMIRTFIVKFRIVRPGKRVCQIMEDSSGLKPPEGAVRFRMASFDLAEEMAESPALGSEAVPMGKIGDMTTEVGKTVVVRLYIPQ